jgi:hypothetical protein
MQQHAMADRDVELPLGDLHFRSVTLPLRWRCAGSLVCLENRCGAKSWMGGDGVGERALAVGRIEKRLTAG